MLIEAVRTALAAAPPDRSAGVNAVDAAGRTALHVYCLRLAALPKAGAPAALQVVELLLGAGARVACRDDEGKSVPTGKSESVV